MSISENDEELYEIWKYKRVKLLAALITPAKAIIPLLGIVLGNIFITYGVFNSPHHDKLFQFIVAFNVVIISIGGLIFIILNYFIAFKYSLKLIWVLPILILIKLLYQSQM